MIDSKLFFHEAPFCLPGTGSGSVESEFVPTAPGYGHDLQMQDWQGYKDTVVTVYESEKRLKKEVQVNDIDGGGVRVDARPDFIEWVVL